MDRRAFLRGATAVGVAAALPRGQALATDARGPEQSVQRIAVIGAGIVGAAIAYNLSKRGCEVLLLDKVGPAAQASGNSFAWINASYFDRPDSYFELRARSLNEYHRLENEIEIPIRWGGSLEWYHDVDRQQELIDGVARVQRWGTPNWIVDAARVAEIEPNLDLGGDWLAMWSSRDGAVDPAGTTRALVDAAIANGATPMYPVTVTGIHGHIGAMRVDTDVGSIDADLVVAAPGIAANDIAEMIGLGTRLVQTPTPGIIVTTKPMQPILETVCYTTDSHFHQLADGRLLLGEKAGAPVDEQHAAFLAGQPNEYPNVELAREHGARVIETCRHHVAKIAQAEISTIGVGWRPLPIDGLPVIGHVTEAPGVYLASMHSGVTLAPIVGHLASMEILDRVRVDLLQHFRVERFL